MKSTILITLLFCTTLPFAVANAEQKPPTAAIATAHPLATEAGFEILAAGGNAFDAAVAISASLAVVEPAGSGLGGGGFWLLHQAETSREVMLDGRERAPLASAANMYQDKDGNPVPELSRDGAMAAGIPGEPAALVHLASEYGRLPLAQSLAPAIRQAREGYAVDARMQRYLTWRKPVMEKSPAAYAAFYPMGDIPEIGATIRQPDLAVTLERIAKQGHDGFYAGATAEALVKGTRAAGGIWTQEDLDSYQVVERQPIRFDYGEFSISSAAPPSSGGVVLAEALQILAGMKLERRDLPTRTHLIVEAMRRAYRDRAEWLGDPDHVKIPLRELTSLKHAEALSKSIHVGRATPSDSLQPAPHYSPFGADTTHFSVLDIDGNRVAATLSINLPFGSGFMPPGTGVLLNDEMDDFTAKPGTPNAYGLVHSAANAVAPGKRMLSSMSPTFIESERGVAILGTPGGSRIISMVLLAILDYADGGDADSMVALPRFHHQYLPDEISFEPNAFDIKLIKHLHELGHDLIPRKNPYGNMQVITWDYDSGKIAAAADPRGVGSARLDTE